METFVVRLWTDPAGVDESGSPQLKGSAHQVGTGVTIRFHDQDELIEFLTSWSARVPAPPEPGVAKEV